MTSEVWSPTLPVSGLPLKKLCVIGSGKDLDMHILPVQGPLLRLPLEKVNATVSKEVALEITRLDDVSLELAYEAPQLLLIRLRVHWDEDVMPGVEEELRALFEGLEKDGLSRRELFSCVAVEFILTTVPNSLPGRST